jgi:hypothetical protein
VIAKGSSSVAAAGTHTVKLKLTRAGKRLLRGGRRLKGKLSAGFAGTGGGSLTRTRGVTLKRALVGAVARIAFGRWRTASSTWSARGLAIPG